MVIQTSIILWSTQYGLGIPPAKLDIKKVPTLISWTPTALFVALSAAALSKLSFFITLIRVCSKRWQKVILWVVAIHSTILVMGTSVLGYVDCNFYRAKDPQHHHNCVPERVGKILALTVLIHGAVVVSTFRPWICKLFKLIGSVPGILFILRTRLVALELGNEEA